MARIGENISAAGYVPQSIRRRSNIEVYSRALDKIDAAHKEALDQITEINAAIGQLELNEAEDEFRLNYINKVKSELDKYATHGNYSGALDAAKQAAANILSDPAIRGRLKYQQEYKKQLDQIQNNPNLNQVTKDRWMEENPYNYQDKYDSNGNVIGGSSWKNQWTPVNHVNLTEIYSKLKDIVATEAGGSENATFLDENGNLTNDVSKGFYGMAVKKGTEFERLSEDKLQESFDKLFREYPNALESIMQDRDDRLWQYNKTNDEDKKQFVGSDIMDERGEILSSSEYLKKRVTPILHNMAFNHVHSTVDYGQAYSLRAKAQKDQQGKQAILDLQGDRNTSMTTPIEVSLQDRFGHAYAATQTALGTIAGAMQKTPYGRATLGSTKWTKDLQNGDYDKIISATKAALLNDNSPLSAQDKLAVQTALSQLKSEGGLVNAMLSNANSDDRDAILFDAAITAGAKPPVNNKYTIEYNKKKNELFSYIQNGKRVYTDELALGFVDDNHLNEFIRNLGISENKYNDFGLDIRRINNTPILVVNKNSTKLTDVADTLDKIGTKRGNWFTRKEGKLYRVASNGDIIVNNSTPWHEKTQRFVNYFKTNGYASNYSNDRAQKAMRNINAISVVPMQVKPTSDYNVLALDNLYFNGYIERPDWEATRKKFEEDNKKEIAFGIQNLENFKVYYQKDGKGNLIEAPLKKYDDIRQALLTALDDDNVDLSPGDAPIGLGYGTLIRTKIKTDSKNKPQSDSNVYYIDGLLEGAASKAFAENPELRAQHEFKNYRAINYSINDVAGNPIDYNEDTAFNKYYNSLRLDEVYNAIDTQKLLGKALTKEQASEIATDLLVGSGYNPASASFNANHVILTNKLLDR